MIHLYTGVSYTILVFMFACWYPAAQQRILYYSIGIIIGLQVLLLATGVEQLATPNKYSMIVSGLFLIILAVNTLRLVTLEQNDTPIYLEGRFWISLAILLLYPGRVLIFAGFETDFAYPVWGLNEVLTIFSNLAYMVALICPAK